MKKEVKQEILYDLKEVINILKVRENSDVEKLKALSDHAIEDVAVHKDLDVISVTVLIYSLYKVVNTVSSMDYNNILMALQQAQRNLEQNNLGKYNSSIKKLFAIVQKVGTRVREHLQDVMQAARIKKGTALLEKGLSIGQAAGLMGLSNWDLQQYAAKTPVLQQHEERIPAEKRLATAFALFNING